MPSCSLPFRTTWSLVFLELLALVPALKGSPWKSWVAAFSMWAVWGQHLCPPPHRTQLHLPQQLPSWPLPIGKTGSSTMPTGSLQMCLVCPVSKGRRLPYPRRPLHLPPPPSSQTLTSAKKSSLGVSTSPALPPNPLPLPRSPGTCRFSKLTGVCQAVWGGLFAAWPAAHSITPSPLSPAHLLQPNALIPSSWGHKEDQVQAQAPQQPGVPAGVW